MHTPTNSTKPLSLLVSQALINQDSEKAFGILSGPNNGGKWHWGFHGNCCKLLRGLLWKHMSDLTGLFTVSLATDSLCSLSHCLAQRSLFQHLTCCLSALWNDSGKENYSHLWEKEEDDFRHADCEVQKCLCPKIHWTDHVLLFPTCFSKTKHRRNESQNRQQQRLKTLTSTNNMMSDFPILTNECPTSLTT